MATSEERMQILKMVEEGKLSAEEGARLLAALSAGAVSYTHLTLPTTTLCRSRWSPYH